MSLVAIFLRQKEEGFLFGGESSTLASLRLCAADCAREGIAVAVELSISYTDVSDK